MAMPTLAPVERPWWEDTALVKTEVGLRVRVVHVVSVGVVTVEVEEVVAAGGAKVGGCGIPETLTPEEKDEIVITV